MSGTAVVLVASGLLLLGVIASRISSRLGVPALLVFLALGMLTDDIVFGQIWTRDELSRRDRSLVTVAALTAGGNFDQLRFHLPYAIDNGVTKTELIEVLTHLAFYAGWPKAVSAINIAKEVLPDH